MRTDPHTLPLTTTCEPWHVCVLLTQINAFFFIFIILFICIFIIIFHYFFSGRDYPNTPCFSNSGSDDQDSCWLPGEQHTQQGYCWTERRLQDYTKLLRTLSNFKPMLSSGVFRWIFPDTVKLKELKAQKGKKQNNLWTRKATVLSQMIKIRQIQYSIYQYTEDKYLPFLIVPFFVPRFYVII